MSKRFYILSIILPAILCASITGFAQKTKPVEKAPTREIVFRDPAGLFTIVAPVELKLSDKPSNASLFGGITKTEYFQVIHRQVFSPNHQYANILTNQVAEQFENHLLENGSIILDSRRENIFSYFLDYRQKISKTEYAHTYSRSFVKNGIFFDLVCTSLKHNVKINARICNKFLYSIKFLD